MDLGLSGCGALVTAASRGLGRACAEALAKEGARVFIASRDEAEISRAAQDIRAAGWRAADVGRGETIPELVRAAVATLGRLDVLVVNAGGPSPGSFESLGEVAWEQAFQLTLMSAVRLIRETLPHLKAAGRGRIVNIVSVSAKEPLPNLVLSNSLRAAVVGMAKTLADEVGPDGVTVNNIAPQTILTDRIRQLHAPAAQAAGIPLEDQLERVAAAIPVRRLGRPEELGALCTFLCSLQAGYVTGQTIAIDGGASRSV